MKKVCSVVIALIYSFLCAPFLFAQDERTDTVKVYFQQGKSVYNPDFRNNESRLQDFVSRVQSFREDSAYSIHSIHIIAVASPEGRFSLNQRLSLQRAESVSRYMKSCLTYGDSLVRVVPDGIDWGGLTRMVSRSDMPHKQEVLDVLAAASHEADSQAQSESLNRKLRSLHGGTTWKYINRHFFPELRTSDVTIVLKAKPMEQVSVPLLAAVESQPEMKEEPKIELPQPVVAPAPVVEPEPAKVPEAEGWIRQLHVKTNGIALAMAIVNVGVEVDICKHLSFTLPIYFSAWDYFKSTLKFRTFCIQPEFRYWFNEHNEGWFVGAHFGGAFYNYALGGDWRYQDYARETPSLGGGLSAGYRKAISKDKRWKMEFTLGGGVYDSHYDKFYNEPNGRLQGDYRKTWYGIDQVAVSIAYAFDLKKKGGKR